MGNSKTKNYLKILSSVVTGPTKLTIRSKLSRRLLLWVIPESRRTLNWRIFLLQTTRCISYMSSSLFVRMSKMNSAKAIFKWQSCSWQFISCSRKGSLQVEGFMPYREFEKLSGSGVWDCSGTEWKFRFYVLFAFTSSVYMHPSVPTHHTCPLFARDTRPPYIWIGWRHIQACRIKSQCGWTITMKERAMLKGEQSCRGTRTTNPRQPQLDSTPLIFMKVSSCLLSRMLPRVSLCDQTYELFCITYQGADHRVGCISIGSKGRHLYDGLELHYKPWEWCEEATAASLGTRLHVELHCFH